MAFRAHGARWRRGRGAHSLMKWSHSTISSDGSGGGGGSTPSMGSRMRRACASSSVPPRAASRGGCTRPASLRALARDCMVAAPRAPLACSEGAAPPCSELPPLVSSSSPRGGPTRRRLLWRSSMSVQVCFVACAGCVSNRVATPSQLCWRQLPGTPRRWICSPGCAPQRRSADGTSSTSGRISSTCPRSPRSRRAGAACRACVNGVRISSRAASNAQGDALVAQVVRPELARVQHLAAAGHLARGGARWA